MSDIQPLQGIRYAPPPTRDISSLIAPPYDVLSAADKQALLDRDPRNFVAIDLPHVPAKDAGPPEVYRKAAQQFDAWLADGTLVQDGQPGLYVYHQRYVHQGKPLTRRKFFARLRLEPLGEGSVYPHERTFGGPKEDRLALMKATRAQLSPIFMLFEDPDHRVMGSLDRFSSGEPDARGALDGVENSLWAVQDVGAIQQVQRALADRGVFIADGHHRYSTALMYRNWLVAERGPLPANHPANFVLVVLAAMEDTGLVILPTHRVVPAVKIPLSRLREDSNLTVDALDVADPESVIPKLAAYGPQAIGVFDGSAFGVLSPRDPAILDTVAPERSPAWRRLALALLHAYTFPRFAAHGDQKTAAGAPAMRSEAGPAVQYLKSATEAVQAARTSGGAAFLMQPTTMQELRDVCTAGDLMPEKSTFFYPKLASGLISYRLE